MRFIHTADWQIGKPFLRFGAKAEALRAARLDAIEQVGRLADAEGVAHILVAGDVFDAETPSNVTVRGPLERMQNFGRINWHLLPGNHDPHRPGGVWERMGSIGFPANVRLHLSPAPVEIADGCFLLPAPLTSKAETRDLTARMDEAATPVGATRIGLAHGAIADFGAGEGDARNRIDPARAQRAGLDYLALGDWHRTQAINARTWYAGTPEPDRHDSQNFGQALLVTVAESGAPPVVEPRRVGTYRWHSEAIHLTELDQLAAQEAALRAAVAPLSRLVLDLAVTGAVSIAGRRRIDDWIERLQAAVFHLDADLDLRIRPDPGDLESIDFDGVLRRAAETLRTRAGDEALALADRQIAEESLMMLYLEATA
ncbi:MAG: DNA repair exonuclease [Xanthobacteraceae bacterium]